MKLRIPFTSVTYISAGMFACWLLAVCMASLAPAAGAEEESAASKSKVGQVAQVLIEQAAQQKIKVVIFDFGVSSLSTEKKLTDRSMKDLSAFFTEEFTAGLLNNIKNSGKQDSISIIDASSLSDILRQKNVAPLDASREAVEIARAAGMDIAITGKVYYTGQTPDVTVKVVSVKDGAILTLANETRQKKSPVVQQPATLIDQTLNIKIGEWKTLPVNVSSDGVLSIAVDVVRGNALDVYLVPSSELENVRNRREARTVPGFEAAKTENYRQSADIRSGNYHLVIIDKSLGVFSKESSDIKVSVQLQP